VLFRSDPLSACKATRCIGNCECRSLRLVEVLFCNWPQPVACYGWSGCGGIFAPLLFFGARRALPSAIWPGCHFRRVRDYGNYGKRHSLCSIFIGALPFAINPPSL